MLFIYVVIVVVGRCCSGGEGVFLTLLGLLLNFFRGGFLCEYESESII